VPRLRLVLLAAVLVGATGLPVLGSPSTAAAAATPTAGQSTYVPLSPVRLLDTREASDPLTGAAGPGGTKDLQVAGVAGVPAEATAVVLNVTVVQPTSSTDVRVYPTPTDGSVPLVSNLNAPAGLTFANLVTVKVGDGGKVRLRNQAGDAHLVADLSGYYVQGASGASYTGTTPRRLLDTRNGAGALGPGEVRGLAVRGGEAAPEGATAVVLNVTAVSPTQGTDVRVYPSGSPTPPEVSNLNPPAGRTTPAAVVVAVGADGAVALRNEAGSVHLVVDLSGWYVPGTDGAVFHPVAPVRLLDMRDTGTRLGDDGTADLQIGGAGVVPHLATAVVLNVTATGVSSSSDVRVYPTPNGDGFPLASNLNVVRGQTVPNTVFATLGRDGSVRMRNEAGTVALIADLSGWFGPAGEGWDISWPQCTPDRASATSRHPEGGAFAVIGLTDGTRDPFSRVSCFADAYAWASSLPGDPSVYVILNAPGPASTNWTRPGPRACDGTHGDRDCGWNYGWNIADNLLGFLPTDPDGSRPMVWLDVEGFRTYATGQSGPTWSTSQAVNADVVSAAIARLSQAGLRLGAYSTTVQWKDIVGDLTAPSLQSWAAGAPASNPESYCTPVKSFTGGTVTLTQYQTTQPDGFVYDTNHPC
jgi:hypothetical protein